MTGTVRYGAIGWVGFGLLTIVNVVSTTMLIWLAAHGRSVLVVFPFCVGAWGAYLCSHYLVDGEFIDRTDPDSGTEGRSVPARLRAAVGAGEPRRVSGLLPSSGTRQVLAIVGIGSMFITFPTGIVAVRNDQFWLLFVSATLFVVGYIVGHQGVTGKPL